MNKDNTTSHPNLPPCSICGAGPEKRVWSQTHPGPYGNILILSEKPPTFWQGSNAQFSQATPVVCTHCGYVQFFVDPEDFQDKPPA